MAVKTKKNIKKKALGHRKVNKKRIMKRILAALFILMIIPLCFLYLYVAYYYRDRFYSNTSVNGINISNMTFEEAENIIGSEVKSYILTLEGRNGLFDSISGKSINLHTVYSKSLSELIKEQNTFGWPAALFKKHVFEVNTMLEYDEALLKQEFENISFLEKENNVLPVNASISKYGDNGYEIIPEKPGAKIIEDKLYNAVKEAVIIMKPKLFLEEVDCYEKPDITAEYPPLKKALDEMNRLAGARITYEFGDKTEVLDGSLISEWISVSGDFTVSFEPDEGIKKYVDYIGKTYNTFGKIRTFKTSYGDDIKVSGGDYGWWLNRPKEALELQELINSGARVKKEPVYFQTAQQYGDDDIGNTYVEVNLTAQHLFFYKEGNLVLESDFVSGNLSKNFGTPTGTYPVQYKDLDAVLVGEDYETPVKYWMPFNRNIGFHDAAWRKEFGKDIYLKSGSHGCINMPPESAKLMYKEIQRGVAVVVYELPGTENYEIEKDDSKIQVKDNKAKKETGN
jgi:hypothetical protein